MMRPAEPASAAERSSHPVTSPSDSGSSSTRGDGPASGPSGGGGTASHPESRTATMTTTLAFTTLCCPTHSLPKRTSGVLYDGLGKEPGGSQSAVCHRPVHRSKREAHRRHHRRLHGA